MRLSDNEIINDPIRDARRYVKNAQDALRDHGKFDTETGRYEDSKYVKAAGHYLWSGVLIALEAVFHVEGDKRICQRGIQLTNTIIDKCESMMVA